MKRTVLTLNLLLAATVFSGNEIKLGTESFSVGLDNESGAIAAVTVDGQKIETGLRERFFDIQEDRGWRSNSNALFQVTGIDQKDRDTAVTRMTWGPWVIEMKTTCFPEKRMIRRAFVLTWMADTPTKIRSFWFKEGIFPIAPSGSYRLPGRFPAVMVPHRAFQEGRKQHQGGSPPVVIADFGTGLSAFWTADHSVPYADHSSLSITECAKGLDVVQSFATRGHVRKGVPIEIGDAWTCFSKGDAETALRNMKNWFVQVGQTVPKDRPEWLKSVLLYSMHPGGTTGSMFRDLGGFQAARALLPHIRGLGCNAIWVLPVEDESVYSPRDYYKLAKGLGTPDDYKAFTAEARRLGMRVWQDCVPHGGRNTYPRALQHPEWLVQREDGSTLDYWCYDFNWPTWIAYMSDVVRFYTREYGLNGLRIDACGGSKEENWNPAIPYARASHSQSQGGLAMQKALRQAVKSVCPDGANLAEAGDSIHGTISDATYDFRLCYEVLHGARKMLPGPFVGHLRQWLHEQHYAEVPDLIRMRHIESHDSLRSVLWYGRSAQLALFAITAWIDGFPMVYQEMEDGEYADVAMILKTRSALEELNTGDVDYLSTQAPDGVFTCVRMGQRTSVVVVNLNPTAVQGTITESRLGQAVYDVRTGQKIAVEQGRFAFSLPAFGYTVFRSVAESCPTIPAAVPLLRSATLPWTDPAALLEKISLSVPDALQIQQATNAVVKIEQGFTRSYTVGTNRLVVSVRTRDAGAWAIEAAWQPEVVPGIQLRLDLSGATTWFAATHEGCFESPFRVRHPHFDGIVGSIYRYPKGDAVLWDSLFHPFGLTPDAAYFGGTINGQIAAFYPEQGHAPRRVQLLDHSGSVAGLVAAATWQGPVMRLIVRPERIVDSPKDAVDQRLKLSGGGWLYENDHYRVQLKRNGALSGFWRKDGTALLASESLYTDHGYGKVRYERESDVEADVRIQREGSKLILTFEGELRGMYRFDKMHRPVRYFTAYVFDETPAFRLTTALQASQSADVGSVFLADQFVLPDDVQQVRYVTAGREVSSGSITKGRFGVCEQPVDQVQVTTTAGARLVLSDLQPLARFPLRLFAVHNFFFIAWQDGQMQEPALLDLVNGAGLSMSISADETTIAPRNTLRPETRYFESWSLPPRAWVCGKTLQIQGEDGKYLLARQKRDVTPFKPGTRWRFSGRLSGQDVRRGKEGWMNGCLRWSIRTASGSSYITTGIPFGTTPMKTYSVDFTVPEKLKEVVVEVGLNGPAGTLRAEDLKVERLE